MRGFILGFVFAVFATLAVTVAYQAYSWKRWVGTEAWYLNEPVARTAEGVPLTRKQLLDLLLAERLKAQPKP